MENQTFEFYLEEAAKYEGLGKFKEVLACLNNAENIATDSEIIDVLIGWRTRVLRKQILGKIKQIDTLNACGGKILHLIKNEGLEPITVLESLLVFLKMEHGEIFVS